MYTERRAVQQSSSAPEKPQIDGEPKLTQPGEYPNVKRRCPCHKSAPQANMR